MPIHRRFGVALAGALATLALLAPASASAFTNPLGGWWPMNEGRGQTIYDWSGNGNHGQLGSTPAADVSDPAWVKGVFAGSALRFGGDDFVQIPSSPSLQPQKITVSAWVRADASPGSFRYVVAKGAAGRCLASSYGLYTADNGGLAFYVYDGSGDTGGFRISPKADAPAVWDGRWHHVAGTDDGQTVRLFVDGGQVGAGTPATAPIAYDLDSADGLLGGYVDGSCSLYLVGDIDGVSVWNRALPVADLALVARQFLAGR